MAKKKAKEDNGRLAGLIVFAVVLFFIAYMVVFFVGRNRSINRDKKEADTKQYTSTVTKVDLNDDRVTKAIKNYESFNFDESVYHLDSLELEEVSRYNFILAALTNIDNNKIAYCISNRNELKEAISIDELNAAVHKVGDINISIDDLINNAKESGNTVGDYGYGFYSLIIDGGNIYVIGACDAMDGDKLTVTKVEQAEELGNYINIYIRVAFGERSGELINYYDNFQREGNSKEKLKLSEEPNFSRYKYALYKITFMKDGDNYYFQSIVSRS